MDLKDKKSNKRIIMIILAIATIAVLFVPMIYSSIYLGSIWDAYGKIDKVPVAFVNLDKPFIKNGKEYSVGKELESNLKDNNKVAWRFVGDEEARLGVEGTDYYALIEIPKDFSEKIANSAEGQFSNPQVVYMANKGKNFVFSQISEKVAESIKVELSSNIQKEISKALVNSLYDVKVSIKEASNGVAELQDGTQKLLDGSKELTSGVKKASTGSMKLEGGLKQATDASAKLQDGTEKLLKGSTDLSDGLNTAVGGSSKLEDGLKSLINGESQVVGGSNALVNGLNDMKNSVTNSSSEVNVLAKGALDVSSNTLLVEQGAEQLNTSLNTGLNSLADGVKQVSSGISQASLIMKEELYNINNSNLNQADKEKLTAAILAIDEINSSNISSNIEAPLRKAANSAEPLVVSLKQLKDGTKEVSNGVSKLTSGLADNQNKVAAGLDQLISGAKGIQKGSSTIFDGLNTVSDKTYELGRGLAALNGGSSTLSNGLKVLNQGNITLKDGLNTAAINTGVLSDGLKQLSDGSVSLNRGMDDANDGVGKLKDGLNDGYVKISDNLKFSSEDMSKFISEPVTLKNISINDVNQYGEGLAPYFISLSLWIGAMFISIIFSVAKSIKIFKGKFSNSFLGKFFIGSVLVAIQSLILSFVLVKGLGMSPVSITSFYISNVFIAVVFFSIMYGVSHAIGIMGAPIMFIVLVLQLASSGGTFPIQTAPAFYRMIGNIIPMTYSVNTLRMIVSGINSSLLKSNIVVLMIFMLGSLFGGFLIRLIINLMKKKEQVVNNSQVI